MAAAGGVVAKPAAGPKPQEQLPEDDKVLRRRMQYKFHQRRHRAKQKEKMLTLSHDVQTLVAEIEQLSRKRQRLVERNCFSSRGTDTGVPARLAMEYFRLFEFGISARHVAQQEQFLRSIMTAETAGPDYAGVETVIMLWKRFSAFYNYSRYELVSMDVANVAESTVVVMDTFFHIRCAREGVLTLYPSLRSRVELLQKMIGTTLVVPVQYRFEFDANGLVTWFSADWDLVSALQSVVGSLVDAACILAGANIAKTGQIRSSVEDLRLACTTQETVAAPALVDPRHSVDFLLS
jgi:outer membrane murein-binding lipoprotein Lpp